MTTIYLLEDRDARNPDWSLNEDRDVYLTREAAEAGREDWLRINGELIDQGHDDLGYEVRVVEYRRATHAPQD